ncbi:hypothetical protein MUK42_30141 [Musa troglodytarum]|uniref:Uncharacterized protein n=1 Tax=Musa troglodytarum TaxID=320322 RepID=A0A9E7F4N3_9LILI|nr:hypothetical protein MUK42_30141 [Musa troglodytarum]
MPLARTVEEKTAEASLPFNFVMAIDQPERDGIMRTYPFAFTIKDLHELVVSLKDASYNFTARENASNSDEFNKVGVIKIIVRMTCKGMLYGAA